VADFAKRNVAASTAVVTDGDATTNGPTSRSSLLAWQDMTFIDAAEVLLSSHYTEATGWHRDDETVTPFRKADYITHHGVHGSGSFAAHESFLLPDQPPGDWVQTVVHRFELQPDVFKPLGDQLSDEAARQRRLSDGVHVSNVSGWHSAEECFEVLPGPYHHWYSGALLRVLHDALPGLLESESMEFWHGKPNERPQLDDSYLTGWLNSSGQDAFNVLHDHGADVAWSLVLFVRHGEEGVEGCTALPAETASSPAPGSLLLKMQLAKDLPAFSYLSIDPRPGDLWAFPGYVQHAVLPRRVGLDSSAAAPVAVLTGNPAGPKLVATQRISLAMNIYKPKEEEGAQLATPMHDDLRTAYKGVQRIVGSTSYTATVYLDGRAVDLGIYDTTTEASVAVALAERRHTTSLRIAMEAKAAGLKISQT